MKKLFTASLIGLASAGAFAQSFPYDSLIVLESAITNPSASGVATAASLVGYGVSGAPNGFSKSLGTSHSISSTATSEGILNWDAPSGLLGIAGYQFTPDGTTAITGTSSNAGASQVLRQVAIYDNGTGTFQYQALGAGEYNANNIRSAFIAGGTLGSYSILTAGTSSSSASTGTNAGWRRLDQPATTSVKYGTSRNNTRVIRTLGGDVWGSSGSGSIGIYKLTGTGADTAAPFLATTGTQPYDFDRLVDGGVSYLLVADDALGLQVYNESTKALVGTVATTGLRNFAIRNWKDTGGVSKTTIFGITGAATLTTGNNLSALTFDTGSLATSIATSSFSTLRTSSAGTWYRGVEVVPEPATFAVIGVGLAGLAARRRRK